MRIKWRITCELSMDSLAPWEDKIASAFVDAIAKEENAVLHQSVNKKSRLRNRNRRAIH